MRRCSSDDRPRPRERRDDPLWKAVDTPPGGAVSRRRIRVIKRGEKRGEGGRRNGEVSETAWSELSAVGQLSALLSSLSFMSNTIYLAVKLLLPSHSPLSPSSSLTDSITTPHSLPLCLSLFMSLVAAPRRPPLCPLILLDKSLNGLQYALFSDIKVYVF